MGRGGEEGGVNENVASNGSYPRGFESEKGGKRPNTYSSKVFSIAKKRLHVWQDSDLMLLAPFNHLVWLRKFEMKVHGIVHNLIVQGDVEKVGDSKGSIVLFERDLPFVRVLVRV